MAKQSRAMSTGNPITPSKGPDVSELVDIALHSCSNANSQVAPSASDTFTTSKPADRLVQVQTFLDAAMETRKAADILKEKTKKWVSSLQSSSPSQWSELSSKLAIKFQVPAISEPKYSDAVNAELRVLLQLALYNKFLNDQSGSNDFGQYSPDLNSLGTQMSESVCAIKSLLADLTDEEITAYVQSHSADHIVDIRDSKRYLKRIVTYVALANMVSTFDAMTISLADGGVVRIIQVQT